MFFTHFYDLILKVASFILILMFYDLVLPEGHPLAFLFVLTLWIVLYFYMLRTVGSYLYCRLTLRMKVSLSQAKELNGAFSPIITIWWLPMRYLKKIDQELRYETALAVYREWDVQQSTERQQYINDFENAGGKTQILTVLIWLSAAYMFVAGFANWPPNHFVTAIFCTVFNTNEYYPVLNGLIMMAPVLLIFKLIDRNIRIK